MTIRHLGLLGAGFLVTVSTLGAACSSSGSGGNTGTGGSNAGPACTSVVPCTGSVVGTWKVASSCLTMSGDMETSFLSLGCPTVPVSGSLSVTGTFVANSDGTYTDNTTTTG